MDPGASRQIPSLLSKKHVTILVTDSGLGGLSIFANIAARLKTDPLFPAVTLIYYNAWPEQNRGYNRLKNTRERVRVFDQALAGMQRYRPDLILIACNTLSVLYDRTAFSRRQPVAVIDIVRFGVDMLYEALSRQAGAAAVILGTVATIASGVHRSRLIAKGIFPDRLVIQPCDQLATRIEKGPCSEAVKQLLATYTDQAVKKLGPTSSRVFVALFCTHFGYCRHLIKAQFERWLQAPVTVLDPNQRMAAFLFEAYGGRRHDRTVVDMQVVSRIHWDQAKIDAISEIIKKQSPETAQALKNYEHKPDLFRF